MKKPTKKDTFDEPKGEDYFSKAETDLTFIPVSMDTSLKIMADSLMFDSGFLVERFTAILSRLSYREADPVVFNEKTIPDLRSRLIYTKENLSVLLRMVTEFDLVVGD